MSTSDPLPPLPIWQFTDHDTWYWDVARVATMAAGILLMVVCLRIAYIRWRHPQPGEVFTHPATLVSYSLFILDIVIRRLQYLDLHRPPDLFLPLSAAAVALGWYGVLRRATFSRRNTHSQQQADTVEGGISRRAREDRAGDTPPFSDRSGGDMKTRRGTDR